MAKGVDRSEGWPNDLIPTFLASNACVVEGQNVRDSDDSRLAPISRTLNDEARRERSTGRTDLSSQSGTSKEFAGHVRAFLPDRGVSPMTIPMRRRVETGIRPV